MIRKLWIAGLLAGLLASPLAAEEIVVADGLVFTIDLADGWILYRGDLPEALVKESARHIAHEAAASGATAEQVERAARKRLAANEAIVYHPATGAHLDIDFSPLDQGALPPGPQTVKSSAVYAAQSLEGEDDVTSVDWAVDETKIAGSRGTYLLKASYLKHGRPETFMGFVGSVDSYWFFLYLTVPGEAPDVLAEMTSMLGKASIANAAR